LPAPEQVPHKADRIGAAQRTGERCRTASTPSGNSNPHPVHQLTHTADDKGAAARPASPQSSIDTKKQRKKSASVGRHCGFIAPRGLRRVRPVLPSELPREPGKSLRPTGLPADPCSRFACHPAPLGSVSSAAARSDTSDHGVRLQTPLRSWPSARLSGFSPVRVGRGPSLHGGPQCSDLSLKVGMLAPGVAPAHIPHFSFG
jgi:hypothetical protein